MTTFAFPMVCAHVPADVVRGRSSVEILRIVRAGLDAIRSAPAAENDDARAPRVAPFAAPMQRGH